MRSMQSALLLIVVWSFLSVQVEGQISTKNVLIRAPPPPNEREGPNPGPNPGPGKNARSPPPGKGPGKKAAPAPPPTSTVETSTTTTQSTTEAPPPPSSSTTTTTTSVDPPSTTSSTEAPPPSTSPIVSESPILLRPNPPLLTILPTRISAVLPSPTTSVLPTVPLVTNTPSETPIESTPAATTRSTLIPIPAPLPSLPAPIPPGIVVKEPNPASNASNPQRTLVIVLSVVLGSVGLLLASLALFLVCRYRKKKAALRQASPVEDEEIQTWRSRDLKAPIVASPTYPQRVSLNRSGDAPLASPGWEWFSLDGSRANTPAHSRGPSLIAKAPNARLGLTTDSLPGEDPYLPAVRRQSSRLSKAHQRTKSTRSSLSIKTRPSTERLNDGTINYLGSEYGGSNWFNVDRRSNIMSNAETNSIGTSVYDSFNDIGGLSPRPRNPLVPVFPTFGQPTGLAPPPQSRMNNISKSP